MKLGADAVVVRTSYEAFAVRLRANEEGPPSPEQAELARWGANQLRLGLAVGDPGVIAGARDLIRLIEGERPGLAFGSEREAAARAQGELAFGDVATRLERELLAGRLSVERKKIASFTLPRAEPGPRPPPPQDPARESSVHSFEVRFVDETGMAIAGIEAEFSADGPQARRTNAAGIALLDGVQVASASVELLDAHALSQVLEPRWANFRPGSAPRESNTHEVVFRGVKLGPFALKANVPNTVVVKPPLGQLFVELWDKSGRARHRQRRYSIDGPKSFSGVTDDEGRAQHEQVPGGDYRLTLFLEPGPQEAEFTPQTVVVPLVTLAPAEAAPQVRLAGALPQATLARLRGAFFDTNKTFLLPDGVASLADIEDLFRDNNPSQLLVVGHTDTTADSATNDPLSFERAQSLIAFLRDDVSAWLANYDSPPAGKRWGAREDQAMLSAVADVSEQASPSERIASYQKSRSLTVDGIAGKRTRRQLIREYMALDAATLSDPGFDIPLIAHGCGENFPLSADGAAVDAAPAADTEDGLDRRVELYFFDRDLGPQPPVPGKNSAAGSTQYPEWRRLAQSTLDIDLLPQRRIQLIDEAGNPLVLEAYELITEDGRVIAGVADEDGEVAIPPGVGNEVTLRLTSLLAEVQLAAL